MMKKSFQVDFTVHEDQSHLSAPDKTLIEKAHAAAKNAYAPYSNFKVGAAVQLADGSFFAGSNQENASFPAGICAERVVLSAVSSLSPGNPVVAMAIVCNSDEVNVEEPVAPCGICRQTLIEYEARFNTPIRLLLVGASGKVLEFSAAADLLPLAFLPHHLGR